MQKLDYFLGGYFNQDWDMDAPTAEGIVEFFVANESKERVIGTIKELEDLLGRNYTEVQLEDIVYNDFQCFYSPDADGITLSEWLCWLKQNLTLRAERGSP